MLRDEKSSSGVTGLARSLMAGAMCVFALGAGSSAALAQGATPPDQVYLPNAPMSSPARVTALHQLGSGQVCRWQRFGLLLLCGRKRRQQSSGFDRQVRPVSDNVDEPVGQRAGGRRDGDAQPTGAPGSEFERRGLRQPSPANGPVAAFDGTVSRVAHPGQRPTNPTGLISCQMEALRGKANET